MPNVPRTSLLASLVLLFGGCSYLKNRANDVFDVIRFDIGVDFGLYAAARATDFAAVAFGAKGTPAHGMVGVHGRFAVRYGTLSVGVGPWILGERLDVEPVALLGGESAYDRAQDVVPGQMLVLPLLGVEHAPDWSLEQRGLRVADAGADVTVGLVGIGLGFSPGEFLDLLLGVVGIDLAGDDVFGGAAQPDAALPPERCASALPR